VAIVGVAVNSYFGKRVRLAILQLDLVKLACIKRLHLLETDPTTSRVATLQPQAERMPFKRAATAGLSGA
jgi:biopolymer transport protein ExbB